MQKVSIIMLLLAMAVFGEELKTAEQVHIVFERTWKQDIAPIVKPDVSKTVT